MPASASPPVEVGDLLSFWRGVKWLLGGVGCVAVGFMLIFGETMRGDPSRFAPAVAAFLVGVVMCFLGVVTFRGR
jgi:hypothetical protein